jgi:hypothetical protein
MPGEEASTTSEPVSGKTHLRPACPAPRIDPNDTDRHTSAGVRTTHRTAPARWAFGGLLYVLLGLVGI